MSSTPRPIQLVLLGVFVMLSAAHADATVGEFSIPDVMPLTAAQREHLRELVESDPEAQALAAEAAAQARPLIGLKPEPLEVIHYEGLVNTDPRRIATVAKLEQMADAARLMRYWQVAGDEEAAATLRQLIRAWTQTYKLTGNDVNENKFYPLLVAYHALRDSFEPADREAVDDWVERLGRLHRDAVRESTHFTNRYAKHVRLLAICGMILDRPAWIDEAHQGIRRFVNRSLYADGTSHDLKRRDTLTYHGSALKPVLDLAMLTGPEGRALYTWEGEQGGSLKKSVDYVVPYAMGEKVHREWVNSKVGLDQRRAEAGLEKYRPGRLYDPANALELMEKASGFDPDLMRVVRHLTETEAERFPTWQTLMHAAIRSTGKPSAGADDRSHR